MKIQRKSTRPFGRAFWQIHAVSGDDRHERRRLERMVFNPMFETCRVPVARTPGRGGPRTHAAADPTCTVRGPPV